MALQVLDIVKVKTKDLALEDIELEIAIEEVGASIRNYCNLKGDVPEELRFTHANMAVDLIRYQNAKTKEQSTDLAQISISDIASIKEGDVSITLGSGGSGSNESAARKSHKASLDDIIMNYREQLNSFRRMVW